MTVATIVFSVFGLFLGYDMETKKQKEQEAKYFICINDVKHKKLGDSYVPAYNKDGKLEMCD